jgi:hypothetical protein
MEESAYYHVLYKSIVAARLEYHFQISVFLIFLLFFSFFCKSLSEHCSIHFSLLQREWPMLLV